MKIKINGKVEEAQSGSRLLEIIEKKGLVEKAVVIEYNNTIPARQSWHEILINEGDNIEIVCFVGGG
jgi:sulfur carrier protein